MKKVLISLLAIFCVYFSCAHKTFAASNWMRLVGNNQSIAQLSIPGTHDSGTYDYNGDPITAKWVKCQSQSIGRQLEMGVRFLDIRVGLNKKNELMIYHGSHECERSIYQVMLSVRNFLAEHPSETVICRFSDEYGNKNTIIEKLENLLYSQFGGFIYDAQKIPNMGECRGRFLYWRDYDSGRGLKAPIPHGNTDNNLYSGWKIASSNWYNVKPDSEN